MPSLEEVFVRSMWAVAVRWAVPPICAYVVVPDREAPSHVAVSARPIIRLVGGVAARATKLSWFEATTIATARWAFGRDLKSDTSRRSECKHPSSKPVRRACLGKGSASDSRQGTGGAATGVPPWG